MKQIKTIAVMVAAGALFFMSCSQTEGVDETLVLADKSAELAAICQDSCTFDEELSDADIEGLLFMREEEKLAHDVYLHFYEMYGQQLFRNIANSEESHASAVLTLLNGYGIEDPALEGEGVFANVELETLYNSLIEQGSASLVEALKVGATIEDLDINDLQSWLAGTENTDIIRVYENLLQASENHMRGFVRNLQALGETYTPQFISEEEYAAILATSDSMAYGAGGQGMGYGRQANGKGGQGNGQGGYRNGQNK